ncbi:MAG: hypothetical protein IPJ65_30665 [Archangiaceae bacterium]|nr:hypothetical protein [Archangiaceae bacterium]
MLTLAFVAASLGCLPGGASSEDGVHQRLSTPQGPVHLWCASSRAPTETVIFVHGHELNADEVSAKHGLGQQFKSSGRNALFVVPDAPVNGAEAIKWRSLEELLSTIDASAGVRAPRAVLIVGHSGAYRSIAPWLKSPLANRVVLLDAFYGDMVEYDDWLARQDVRLRVVSALTLPRAEAFLNALDPARRARAVHEQSSLGHWELVSGEETLARVIAEEPVAAPQRVAGAARGIGG